MKATENIPAEIKRLREAMWKAITASIGDVPAWWRAIAAAKRALADGYIQEARRAPERTLLHVALTDAANNLRDAARYDETNALEFEAMATRLSSEGSA